MLWRLAKFRSKLSKLLPGSRPSADSLASSRFCTFSTTAASGRISRRSVCVCTLLLAVGVVSIPGLLPLLLPRRAHNAREEPHVHGALSVPQSTARSPVEVPAVAFVEPLQEAPAVTPAVSNTGKHEWGAWQTFEDPSLARGRVSSALNADRAAARRLAPDIFELLPEDGEFLEGYRTPCWKRNATTLCLPAFYLLGVFQCGVRDLYERLAVHPQIVPSANAMPHFWDEQWPLNRYVEIYAPAVQRITQAPERYIVGDASFSTFTYTWTGSARLIVEWSDTHKRCRERICSGNTTCIALTCYNYTNTISPPLHGGGVGLTLPRLMRSVYGSFDVRMVVILRDPVERLHAAFWNYEHYQNMYGQNESGFTRYAREMVGHVRRCLRSNSEAECFSAFEALSAENEGVFYHADQVLKSIYVHFMTGWMATFGDALLVLRLEDWMKDRSAMRDMLTLTWAHLKLTPLQDTVLWDKALSAEVKTAGDPRFRGKRGQMEPETRDFLMQFYGPYNRRLAELLGDGRFLWGY
jgi:N-acetylgalactosamine 4-sulfate 6-O-sulfotransferase